MDTPRSDESGPVWIAGALVFSGRPDPAWPVTEETVRALQDVWRALDPLPRVAEEAARLGYRGSFLRGPGDQEWRAFANTVTHRSPTGAESRRDERREFEATVLRSAPRGVLPDDPALGLPQ